MTLLDPERVRWIRDLIEADIDRLERFGVLSRYGISSDDPVGPGRPTQGYLLNFKQALGGVRYRARSKP